MEDGTVMGRIEDGGEFDGEDGGWGGLKIEDGG